MQDTPDANRAPAIRKVTIGFRYPEDRVALLDAIAKRRGAERSEVLTEATDALLEREFPGCLRGAA